MNVIVSATNEQRSMIYGRVENLTLTEEGGYLKMRELLRKILSIINVIFLVFTIFWGIDGVIYELVGPEIYEKILAWFRIPWNFEQSFNMAYACCAIWIVTTFLLVKFFGE